jgi:hypothetical protein
MSTSGIIAITGAIAVIMFIAGWLAFESWHRDDHDSGETWL